MSSRPKRVSALRASAYILQEQANTLNYWDEEKELKKALQESLVEAKNKAKQNVHNNGNIISSIVKNTRLQTIKNKSLNDCVKEKSNTVNNQIKRTRNSLNKQDENSDDNDSENGHDDNKDDEKNKKIRTSKRILARRSSFASLESIDKITSPSRSNECKNKTKSNVITSPVTRQKSTKLSEEKISKQMSANKNKDKKLCKNNASVINGKISRGVKRQIKDSEDEEEDTDDNDDEIEDEKTTKAKNKKKDDSNIKNRLPKRVSAQKAAAFIYQEKVNTYSWNGDDDLKKALQQSLIESQKKEKKTARKDNDKSNRYANKCKNIVKKDFDKTKSNNECSNNSKKSVNIIKNKSPIKKEIKTYNEPAKQVNDNLNNKTVNNDIDNETKSNRLPRRMSALKAMAYALWNEDKDLKKALRVSLIEAKKEISINKIREELNKKVTATNNKINEKLNNKSSYKKPTKMSSLPYKELERKKMKNKLTKIVKKTENTSENDNEDDEDDDETDVNMNKKPRIPAQRKFAQGSSVTTPISTPLKVRTPSTESAKEIYTKHRPSVENFLNFLCFRNSGILPPHLDLDELNRRTPSPTISS